MPEHPLPSRTEIACALAVSLAQQFREQARPFLASSFEFVFQQVAAGALWESFVAAFERQLQRAEREWSVTTVLLPPTGSLPPAPLASLTLAFTLRTGVELLDMSIQLL